MVTWQNQKGSCNKAMTMVQAMTMVFHVWLWASTWEPWVSLEYIPGVSWGSTPEDIPDPSHGRVFCEKFRTVYVVKGVVSLMATILHFLLWFFFQLEPSFYLLITFNIYSINHHHGWTHQGVIIRYTTWTDWISDQSMHNDDLLQIYLA